ARVSDIESITRAEHHVDIKAEGLDDATLDRIRAVARSVTRRDGYIYVTLEREEQINQITIIIAESGATLLELKPRQVALEDAFLEVIEETSA
ncbi:MAG: hypothetical protein ACYCXJ_10510, partial [Thermoleophilia bacterium]